jgi:hypothetical protein
MKYKLPILSIPISIGILVLVWAMTDKSASSGQTVSRKDLKGAIHPADIPQFVKHNQGLFDESAKSQVEPAHPSATPRIFVQLVLPKEATDHKQAYIRYMLIDGWQGFPSEWHSLKTPDDNEDQNSTLFSAKFDFDKRESMTVKASIKNSKEVQISAYDANDKLQTWHSDSSKDGDDGDVSWSQ